MEVCLGESGPLDHFHAGGNLNFLKAAVPESRQADLPDPAGQSDLFTGGTEKGFVPNLCHFFACYLRGHSDLFVFSLITADHRFVF